MAPRAAYTAVWPESAFTPEPAAWSVKRSGSVASGSSGGGKARCRSTLVRPSKARHLHEAARFANPVVESYMAADSYEDYRGLLYKARTGARAHACWRWPPDTQLARRRCGRRCWCSA